jgi:DNA helicase-2/ATP-dependent DNA helicase PcrA
MKFIGDFHIHSHYSVATSKELRPDFLDYWARLKGIKVVGTGDFTHPGWLQELKEQFEPAENGLFKVKQEYKREIYFPVEDDVRFILTAEISNIYKKNGKVRKVHNVVFAPSFEVVEKIQNKLVNLGFNITSDGRPILGMDSRDLLELCLDCSEDIFFVPAHIWTPWFSVLGSKSGFDSVEECFEDLSPNIYAVETGLSTDPPMNWTCSFLDKYTLTANSDAHSPEKLGRNANIFNTELSYEGIVFAMKTGSPGEFLGTIDFFPQEGKYHYDGHRKCGICWSPLDTLQHDEICPVCGKKITVGVMNRIAQLADRDDVLERKNRHNFFSLIPLKEILSELEGVSPDSKKVAQFYKQLVRKAGSELNLLMHYDIEDVRTIGGELVSEAVRRMRNREVYIQEGFDGEFGVIKVFKEGESENYLQSASLFEESESKYLTKNNPRPLMSFNLEAFRKLKQEKAETKDEAVELSLTDIQFTDNSILSGLNHEQGKATTHYSGPAIILAGPGTGKTKVLTTRMAYLILNKNVNPGSILAITFTNKAAREMRNRLSLLLDKHNLDKLNISTFHAFGLSIIKEYLINSELPDEFTVINEDDKKQILSGLGVSKSGISEISEKITEIKQTLKNENEITDTVLAGIFKRYNQTLRHSNIFDYDDLISFPVQLFLENPVLLSEYRKNIQWILVDEYQDVNFSQYRLIRMLMPEPDSNLFVIGDPDQAIYGFRGANVQYIQMFKDDYLNASIFKLEKSYRCTDSILRASGNVLKESRKFLEGLQKGVRINISENVTDKSEAEFIARTIEKMIGGVGFFSIDSQVVEGHEEEEIESLSDFAVLCRIGKQMPVIEKALKDHNIPYQKVGEDPFFRQEPVKSVLDVYRFVTNTGNIFLKERLLKQEIIDESSLALLMKTIDGKTLVGKLEHIFNTCFLKDSEKNSFILSRLIEIAKEYEGNEEDFLQHILLGTGIDTWKSKIEAVNLMTLHASKGLEFNCVFIAGCEESLIPYSLFEKSRIDPDEERRLLYVGMTRAKNYLFLSYAKRRFLMGKEYFQKRSFFLDQIEKELVEIRKQEIKKTEKKDKEQLKLF